MSRITMHRYSANDILEIERDFYAFQTFCDANVHGGHQLRMETTISDWRRIRDLQKTDALSVKYCEYYGLQGLEQDLFEILRLEQQSTLAEFCSFVAANAERVSITPAKLLGSDCKHIGLFQALEAGLKERGVSPMELKPSGNFASLFNKYTPEITEVVARLAPGTLREYTSIRTSRYAWLPFEQSNLSINGLDTINDLVKAMNIQVYGV